MELVLTLLVSTDNGPLRYSCVSASSRPSTSIGFRPLAMMDCPHFNATNRTQWECQRGRGCGSDARTISSPPPHPQSLHLQLLQTSITMHGFGTKVKKKTVPAKLLAQYVCVKRQVKGLLGRGAAARGQCHCMHRGTLQERCRPVYPVSARPRWGVRHQIAHVCAHTSS